MTQPSVPLSLSVVVPAYQEAATIVEALSRLKAELDTLGTAYEIVLVSDGCTDGTPDIARGLGIAELRVEHYEPNRGKGHALSHGFRVSSAPIVAFIDADLDIHPRGVGRLIRQLEDEHLDAVVGSKVHRDSNIRYPVFRRMQSRVFRAMVRAVFSLDVADSQTGLKVFRREVLEACLPLVMSTGFAFDLELLVLANDAGFRLAEGPIELDYQFSTTTGVRAVVDTLRDFADIARRRRTLRKRGEWISRQR